MENQIDLLRDKLIQEIEKILNWGPGISWANKDFENLSTQILDHTGKSLSVTTLKRFWGRTESNTVPSISTLDILSEFANYKSWKDFRIQNLPKEKSDRIEIPRLLWYIILGIALVVLIGFIWLNYEGNANPGVSPELAAMFEKSTFEFEKVAVGFPNTVIFKYDIGDLTYDSLSIHQSWDVSKRIPLDEPSGLRTSTYYFPGYFLTKLVWNNQVFKQKELYIPTEGWQAIALRSNGNIDYLKEEMILSPSNVRLSSEILPETKDLYLANLLNDPNIKSSDFELHTSFRNGDPFDHSNCEFTRMVVTGTKEVISLNFSIPGCVGELNHFINQKWIPGSKMDLSGFGVERGSWIDCDLKMENNVLRVSVNQNEVFTDTLTSDIGKIGGVQYWFEGAGEIRSLSIRDQLNEMDFLENIY